MNFAFVLIMWGGAVGTPLTLAPVPVPTLFESEAECRALAVKLVATVKSSTGTDREWNCKEVVLGRLSPPKNHDPETSRK